MSIYRGPGGSVATSNDAEVEQVVESAQTASLKATEAAQSATEASTSASQAATSATNASASESTVSTLYSEFSDLFLGDHATEPTTDNDGDPLQQGAIFYDTTDQKLKYYSGTVWVFTNGKLASRMASVELSGNGNTVFDIGVSLPSEDHLIVYVEGVYQNRDTYTLSGSTLTFSAVPPSGTNNIQVLYMYEEDLESTEVQVGLAVAEAEGYRDEAEVSATNAAASEASASTDAGIASTSATAAQDAQTAAETAESNAATSATSAATSATSAATSASEAASNASAVNAGVTTATEQAAIATTKATEASNSETNASASEASASASAVTATTKASEASTSATNASASAASASASETNASTSETNASNSATAASTSETNAATSASQASTSATNAATSASNAATSAINAENAWDSFEGVYLGAKASDPTLDNDGNALVTGALYWNSATDSLKVYTGSSWNQVYFDGFDGAYSSLTGTPTLFDGAYSSLTGTPTLFSGSYTDLTDKPTIPTVPTNVSSFTNDAGYVTSTASTPSDVALGSLYGNGNNVSGSFTATGNITAYSDESLKENVKTIENALDKTLSLRGVSYDRIDLDGEHHIGFIAQELEKVVPEVVVEDTNGIKTVAYGNLVGLLVEAIKDLNNRIEVLENGSTD